MGRACFIFLFLFYSCCVIQRSTQLFRFCFRGVWHQLLETDCPFGLLFNHQPLQTPCFYTTTKMSMKENGSGGSVPQIWPSLCHHEPYSSLTTEENSTNTTTDDGVYLARKNGEVHFVDFGQLSFNKSEEIAKSKPASVTSLQSCLDRCYRDDFETSHASPWNSSSAGFSSKESSDSLEAPQELKHDKPTTAAAAATEAEAANKTLQDGENSTKSEQAAFIDQTIRLGVYLFDTLIAPEDEEENPGPRLRVVDVFKRSMKILSKSCPHPFVSNNFVNRVLYAFLFLIADSGIGEVEDVSPEEFEEIMVALNECEEKSPGFRLEGTVCDSSAFVKEVIKVLPNGTQYKAPIKLAKYSQELLGALLVKSNKAADDDDSYENDDFIDGFDTDTEEPRYEDTVENLQLLASISFPYDVLDIFSEAAWFAVQITHATCFTTFSENVNMHHRYVSAMEQLFHEKIRSRWRNPTRLADSRMWETWFLADVDATLRNLQTCIQASYMDVPFLTKLDRPIDPVWSSSSSGAKKKVRVKRSAAAAETEDSSKKAQSSQSSSYWDDYTKKGGIRYKLSTTDEVQCFQTLGDRDAAIQTLKKQCRNG